MLESLATALGLIGNGIDGLYLLIDTVLPPLLFGAALGVPGYFIVEAMRDFFRSSDERAATLASLKRDPIKSLWNVILVLGFFVFFGSLFLASLGIPTWWK